MRILIAAACAGAMLGSGCATVTRGTSQAWSVESEPVGASVKLSSGETCKTPCTLKKKRKHPFTVELTLDGYQPVKTDVVSSVSGKGAMGMAGNVLVGGLIGVGIDAGTGATKDLSPNPLVVKLAPVTVTAPAATASVAAAPAATTTVAPSPQAVDAAAPATPEAQAPVAMATEASAPAASPQAETPAPAAQVVPEATPAPAPAVCESCKGIGDRL